MISKIFFSDFFRKKIIKMIRFSKILFIKLKFHHLVPSGFLIYLGNLARLSRFCGKVRFGFDYNERYSLYLDIYYSYFLTEPITYLEFGVGDSIRWWKDHAKGRFYGFDTFEGLPEDWHLYLKGEMITEVPRIENALFMKGTFQKTLPEFLDHFGRFEGRIVIHLDADLYSSTLFVLTTMDRYIKKGDIILFDEFMCPGDEFRAWNDYLSAYKRKFTLIAHRNNYYHVAFENIS